MINILSVIWTRILAFLNNPATKEALKKILWSIVSKIADLIKKYSQQKSDFA